MDLTEFLQKINNHFEREYQEGAFEIKSGVISGIRLNAPALSYVQIIGSTINDGVYQVVSLADENLTLLGLNDEKFSGDIVALSIPKNIVSLVGAITAYETNQSKGITSESIPNYSVSFDQVASSDKFSGRIGAYAKPYMGKFYFKKWATKIN